MFYRKTLIATIITTSLLFFWHSTAFALGLSWPAIGNVKLEEDATIPQLVTYFFTFSIAIGTVVMFFLIIKGGLGFLNSHGSPQAVKNAKTEMIGAGIGMAVLLSSFMIINVINKDILNPKQLETECLQGFKRTITGFTIDPNTGEHKKKVINLCLNTDQPDLAKVGETVNGVTYEKIEDKESSFTKCYLREVITYPEKDYQGVPNAIFKDSAVNDASCPTNLTDLKLGDVKSFKIIQKNEGVYFYDYDTSGSPTSGSSSPYYFAKTVEDFNKNNFNDKAQSIEFVSKGIKNYDGYFSGEYYNGAILFSDANLRGKCFYSPAINPVLVKNDKVTGEKIDLRKDLSSMIFFRATMYLTSDLSKGSIELFAVPNCGQDISETEKEKDGKYDICTIPITPTAIEFADAERKITGASTGSVIQNPDYSTEPVCPDKFLKTDKNEDTTKKTTKKEYYNIQSFRINGSAGVVIKSNAGNCRYFDVNSNERRGNCFTNLQGTTVSGYANGEIPQSIMVIPLNQ